MIPIFIPYVNRPDLLEKAVDSIPLSEEGEWQVEIINNSGKPLPNDDLCAGDCNPNVPLSFAQTQNWMIDLAEHFEAPGFYLFMHSDAEAIGDTVERLVAMANAYTIQKRKWGVIFTAYDALAAFNTAAFRHVGGWDTVLSWYLSDCDMYRRLKLAGYELIDSGLPVKHEPSQTIKSDPYVRLCTEMEIPFRESYYRAKWGGPNEHEVYTVPFNGAFGQG